MSKIAARIKEIRSQLGMTQLEFALYLGVSPSTVYAWESGKKRPGYRSLVALQGIWPLESFLERDDDTDQEEE